MSIRRGGAPSGAMVSAPDGQTVSHSRQEVQLASLVTVDLCETISSTAVGQALTQQAQPTHFSLLTLTLSFTPAWSLVRSTASPAAAFSGAPFAVASPGSSSARRATW